MAGRRVEKTCERCEVIFQGWRDQRFCSRQCWLKTLNVAGADHAMKGAKAAGQWNIANRRGTGKSYVKVLGRHEHRIVAEQMLGRPLESTEIVHHIDGDSKNNAPDNLQIMTQSEHASLHLKERWSR